MKTVFLRVLDASDKATALLAAVREPERARGRQRFEVDPSAFAAVPGSPIAYWVSERLRALFKELPAFETETRTAAVGVQTNDDFRFVRTCWETSGEKHAPLTKGGSYSPYYANVSLMLRWAGLGQELKASVELLYGTATKHVQNQRHYFQPGLTWPLRAHRFSPQALPAGCIFSIRGYCAFVPREEVLWTLAVFNSAVFDHLYKILLGREGFPEFIVGVLHRLPWLEVPATIDRDILASLARRAWSLKRSLDARTETSHAFALPALLQITGAEVTARAAGWSEHVRTIEKELADIQAEIDERCFVLYGIDDADRRAITEGFGIRGSEGSSSEGASDAEEDGEESDAAADAASLAAELVSWAVGIAFGRFDVRLASGARLLPAEPEPFDPMAACSPGMLAGDDAMSLAGPPTGYPLAFPETGVLVDDPGHARDLTAAVRAVFEVVFDSEADRWWNDVAALLDPKGHDLRVWLAGSFFEHHLKRYSKSRRKAPILWQLGTHSGRYSVWLYAHRLTRDSFFQLQNDVVGPKLTHEERQLTSLMQNAGGSPSAPERKEIAAQEAAVEELRAMLDEVTLVAPLWNPNLDDGVVLTMAPLWRLVPQCKPWQKELRTKWHELTAGKYDWAHVAMHLWPERVVPKCASDRSIAIAHEIEELFWLKDFTNRWRAVHEPAQEREYVASHWASSPRTELVEQARELWTQRYLKTGRSDSHWWHDVETGQHDDHSLAIRLWPRRVCELALVDPAIARSHELVDPRKLTALKGQIEDWLEKMSSLHGETEVDRSFMSAAFDPDPSRDWKAWWSQLDDGQLDHLPVARYFRPEEVAKTCQSTLELADAHEVRRFFFTDRGSGVRKRLTRAEELSWKVAERTSPAVKTALKGLLDAPVVSSNGRTRGRCSVTAVATGRNA